MCPARAACWPAGTGSERRPSDPPFGCRPRVAPRVMRRWDVLSGRWRIFLGGVRVPTSVLLAVLAAAGLLALAPALLRRYDATERLVAERALSTARVLARAGSQRHRRRRTIPGRRPINPPRLIVTSGLAVVRPATPSPVVVAEARRTSARRRKH